MLLRSASPPVAPSGIGAWSRTLRRRRGPMPDDDGAADMFMLQFLPFGRCPVEIGAPAPARKAPVRIDPRLTAMRRHPRRAPATGKGARDGRTAVGGCGGALGDGGLAPAGAG